MMWILTLCRRERSSNYLGVRHLFLIARRWALGPIPDLDTEVFFYIGTTASKGSSSAEPREAFRNVVVVGLCRFFVYIYCEKFQQKPHSM